MVDCWKHVGQRDVVQPLRNSWTDSGPKSTYRRICESLRIWGAHTWTKTTQTARNLGRIRQVRIILCTKTSLDFQFMYPLANLAIFAGVFYTTRWQDPAARSRYGIFFSRLTMRNSLAAWSTAGRT